MPGTTPHKWTFKPRFRRHAFGWRSQPAIARIKEAVAEIRKVAARDRVLAAEGAVVFLERVSPAIEQVDGSSGSIGTAVNNAVAALVPIIAGAPAADEVRRRWLERLFEAHAADQMPYIERLAEHWDVLCGSAAIASGWADDLLPLTRVALGPDRARRGFFHGTEICLSALYGAGRFEELVDLLRGSRTIWPYERWAVRALVAQGRRAEALRLAEESREVGVGDTEVDAACEQILLDSGMVEEAYTRYGLRASRGITYLATFRAIARRYPHKPPATILADLASTTPGEEGKWFAAAKDAGLLDEALALASRSPVDPRTLTRAARDHADTHPPFAVAAGLLAVEYLLLGHGYEITGADVFAAVRSTLVAARQNGNEDDVRARLSEMAGATTRGFEKVKAVVRIALTHGA